MLKQTNVNLKELAVKSGASPLLVSLLAHREIKSPGDIQRFLKADLMELYEARKMKDMTKGVNIIKEAINSDKFIYIYGDYDVDGVISTYILFRALKQCGAKVKYHIPDREDEGYGMNSNRVRVMKEEGCEVILTCDNGIAASEQVAVAKELGMKVVVTDHHDVPFTDEEGTKEYIVPLADAVINPKQIDCEYPFKYLCGAGIAFKFAEVLYEEMGLNKALTREFIQFAAVATICDVVDLVDENRIIAKNGLEMLNHTNNIGLRTLMEECGLENKEVSAYHVGFIIGPCINATGRLESAKLSVELLLSENEDDALILAKKLRTLNEERQNMTNKSVEDAIGIINENSMHQDKVLVIYDEEIHESIAGIVAGRIKEAYNVPTIILTRGKEMPKGSARSIEEYNMFDELLKCRDLLSKFGGHPMAAGLSLKKENIEPLRERLNKNCTLRQEDLVPKIRIDHKLPINNVSFGLVEELKKLEPYGKGNSSPLFGDKNVTVDRVYLLGKEKNVIKFSMKITNTFSKIYGIYFDREGDFKEKMLKSFGEKKYNDVINGDRCEINMDIVYYPEINEYNGTTSLQVIVKDIRINFK